MISNRITHLRPGIGNLKKLEFFDVICNEISELPHFVIQLPKLKELHMNYNFLKTANLDVDGLADLSILHIGNTTLRSIIYRPGTLQNLISLDLRSTSIEQFRIGLLCCLD